MAACQQTVEPDLPQTMTRFSFANGNAISDARYDDYNPIIVQLPSGKLVLVFASDRLCSYLCFNHNVYFTTSSAPYNNDLRVPAFQALNIVYDGNTNGTNLTGPIRIGVGISGNQINIYFRGAGVSDLIYQTGFFDPTAGVDIGMPAVASWTIGASGTGCTASNILGTDASGNMISVAGTNAISRYNPASYAGNCNTINMFTNTSLSSALRLSVVRSASIGISEGFLVTEAGGILSAQTATSKGPQIKSFTDGLAAQGLTLTSASVLNANQSSGDLLVFSASAGAGKPSDLYILANKTPAELWLKYVRYGNQPTP